MVMEVYSWDMDDLMKYYDSGSDMPFNFGFVTVNTSCGGLCFKEITKQWMDAMPTGRWPNFVVRVSNVNRSFVKPPFAKLITIYVFIIYIE